MKHSARSLSLLLLLLLAAPASLRAQEEPPASAALPERSWPAELKATQKRGRALAAYDAAAWHGSDAVIALPYDTAGVSQYLARQRDDGRWEVAFGRLSATRDTFFIAYRAVQRIAGDTLYDATRLRPVEPEVAHYPARARAVYTAATAFGPVTRPYNWAVLPAETLDGWHVYGLPATTEPGVWPHGGDVRMHISADGNRVRKERRMHKSILEGRPAQPNGDELVGGVHTAVVADGLEDSDIALVLIRRPRIPEWVVSKSYLFKVDTTGAVTVWKRSALDDR